jgi:hypothetical protein
MALVEDDVTINEWAQDTAEKMRNDLTPGVSSICNEHLDFIKSIDGIECKVELRLLYSRSMEYGLQLKISANHVQISGVDEDWKYFEKTYICDATQEKIAISIRQMKVDVSELEFDKGKSKFVKQGKPEEKRRKLHISVFSTFEKVVTKIDNCCCVCLEDTHTTTKCNHHLCIPCADKIVPTKIRDENEDEDEDSPYSQYVRRCPICRQSDVTYMSGYSF